MTYRLNAIISLILYPHYFSKDSGSSTGDDELGDLVVRIHDGLRADVAASNESSRLPISRETRFRTN